MIGDALATVFVDGPDTFTAIEVNEFNGYYNLLRTNERKIIGLQYYPFEPDVGHALASFDYVSSYVSDGDDYELTIYFGDEREEVHNLTIVQEWGKNYIYQSGTGTLAVSFGIPLEAYEVTTTRKLDS